MADNIGSLMQEAHSLLEGREWDAALDKYNLVLQQDPNSDEACRYLARIYAIRGLLRSVIEVYFKLMDIFAARGDFDSAIEVASWVLTLDPESDQARIRVINLYRQVGNVEEVVYRSRELARLYIELDQGDRSIMLLQSAIEADPNNIEISAELAEMLLQFGHTHESADQYRNVAQAYVDRNEFEKAVEAYNRMKVIVPDDATVLFTLGQLYVKLGKFEEAEKEFRATLRFDFDNEDTLFALGDVAQKSGKYRDATLAFGKIIKANPDAALAKERLGEVYHVQGINDEAINNYLSAAHSYQQFGENEKAIPLYQRVLSLDGSNPTATRELTNLGAPVKADAGNIQVVKKPAKQEQKKTAKKEKSVAGTRSGLVRKDGAGRPGLAPKGGAKPSLGGKPMLGGGAEGETRPGLVRPGLVRPGLSGAKPTLGGKPTLGEKPMLGGKPSLGGKRTLKRKGEFADEPSDEAVQQVDEVAENAEVHDEQPVEGNVQTEVAEQVNVQTDMPVEPQPEVQSDIKPEVQADIQPEVQAEVPLASSVITEADAQVPIHDETTSAVPPSADIINEFVTDTPTQTPVIQNIAEPDFTPSMLSEPAPAPEPPPVPRPVAAASVAVITANPGELQVPTPAIYVHNAVLIASIREQITDYPDPDIIPWIPLPEIDEEMIKEEREKAEESEQSETNEPAGAPVGSRFGNGPQEFDFSQGGKITTIVQNRKRSGRTDNASAKIGKISGSDSLAERIARMRAEQAAGESSAAPRAKTGTNAGKPKLQGAAKLVASGEQSVAGAENAPKERTGRSGSKSIASRIKEARKAKKDAAKAEEISSQLADTKAFTDAVADAVEKSAQNNEQLANSLVESEAFNNAVAAAVESKLAQERAAAEAKAAEEARLAAEAKAAEEARLAAEAKAAEEARLAAEAKAAEEARLAAEAKAAEEARLAAEAKAAEEARLAAEAKAAEEARLAAEAKAAEEARLAAESKAAEETRLAAEAKAAEEARQAAEAKAAEEARLAAEAKAAEEARLAAEAKAAEEARLAAEAKAAEEARRMAEAKAAEADSLAVETKASADNNSQTADDTLYGSDEMLYGGSSADDALYGDSPALAGASADDLLYGGSPSELPPLENIGAPEPVAAAKPAESSAAPSEQIAPESAVAEKPKFVSNEPVAEQPQAEVIPAAPSQEDVPAAVQAEESEKPEIVAEQSTVAPEAEIIEQVLPESAAEETADSVQETQPAAVEEIQVTEPVQQIAASVSDVSEKEAASNQLDNTSETQSSAESESEDALCSLLVESEFSDALVKEAKRMREKLQGADVTTSIGSYRRAVEESPDNLVLRTDLADIHLRYGLLDDAVSQYRQILLRKPESVALRHRLADAYLWNAEYEEAAETLIELSDLHVKNGQNADALDVLQTVLGLDPHHFVARRRLIDRFVEMGKNDLAAHHLRQMAESALASSNLDVAITALKQLMTLSDDVSIRERLAHVYENQGNVTEALIYYHKLSSMYLANGDLDSAVASCEKIAALDPDSLQDKRTLIDLYHRLGRTDLALTAQFDLAGVFSDRGEIDNAIELYEQVIEKDPDYFEARRRLVDCYLVIGNLPAALNQVEPLTKRYESERLAGPAIELYTKLIEADPNSYELRERLITFYTMAERREETLEQLLTLATLHENSEAYREAVRALRRALDIAPKRDDLHYRLAKLYDEKLGSLSGAMQELKTVYELNPANASAVARYARLLMDQKKPKESAEVLKKLKQADAEAGKAAAAEIFREYDERIQANVAEKTEDYELRFVYGELCYNLGRIGEAIKQFQKTCRDRDYELRSFNMLGLAFVEDPKLGIKQAIRQLRKGLETKGHAEQDYIELRYNLAMLLYKDNRAQEALTELKDIMAVDVTYRDVEQLIDTIQEEIARGGPVRTQSKRMNP